MYTLITASHKHSVCSFASIILAIFCLFLNNLSVSAQTWDYNFGTGTGAWTSGTSTTFLPIPTIGTARVSVGMGGSGSFHLENEGLLDFGTDTELRGQASKNGNADKFSVYGFTPSVAYFMHFLFRLDNASDGSWFFCAGNGNSFESDAAASGSQVFTNIQWKFEADGGITAKYRNGPTFINLPSGTFAQGVNYSMDIYMNNSSSILYYQVGALIYTVNAYKWDMWINGSLVSNDLAGGQLSLGEAMDSWMFYSSKSTANLATIYLDDFSILPIEIELLPITIQQFDLEQEINHIELIWKTASENNTYLFEIEHSIDLINFENIGSVNAAGESTSLVDYSFIDNNPSSGVNYYRLKIKYHDGTSQYSNIISTANIPDTKNDLISIYPSPAADLLNIEPNSLLPENFSVTIFDITGMKILELPYSASGYDITILKSGVYLLMINENDFRAVECFVKK